MTLLMRHPLIVSLSIMLLIGQAGCAHGPPTTVAPPPSEHVRGQLGTIGVVSGRFTPQDLDEPSSYQPSHAFLYPTDPDSLYGALVVFGAILLVGGIVALVSALTEENETELEDALARVRIHEGLRDRVLQVAQDKTAHPFVLLTDQGPTARYEKVNYQPLGGKGIDTVLEISVPTIRFIDDPWPPNGLPEKMLTMTALARLIRVEDGKELYARAWEYGGEVRKPVEWVANDAKLLRDELESGFQTLAGWIVLELFLNQ